MIGGTSASSPAASSTPGPAAGSGEPTGKSGGTAAATVMGTGCAGVATEAASPAAIRARARHLLGPVRLTSLPPAATASSASSARAAAENTGSIRSAASLRALFSWRAGARTSIASGSKAGPVAHNAS